MLKVETFLMGIVFILISHVACPVYLSIQFAQEAYEPLATDTLDTAACGELLSWPVIPFLCFFLNSFLTFSKEDNRMFMVFFLSALR